MDDITATLFADLTAQLEDAAGVAADGQSPTLNRQSCVLLAANLARHLGRAGTLLETIEARCARSDNSSPPPG